MHSIQVPVTRLRRALSKGNNLETFPAFHLMVEAHRVSETLYLKKLNTMNYDPLTVCEKALFFISEIITCPSTIEELFG
jgi:hypothetical protein